MAEPTYPLPAVLTAIGISEGTATNWTVRGYKGTRIKASGRGKARHIGVSNIIRLSIMKRCADLGIPPATSATWASVALMTMEQAPFEILRIIIQDDGVETILVDDMAPPPGRPDPIAAMMVTINIRALIASVKARLAELAAINAEDGPAARVRKHAAKARRETVEA